MRDKDSRKEEVPMKRLYNFSAGPSMLPLSVLEQAQKDLVSYQDCGSSVMEMSHRSRYFEPIIQDAEATLRRVMNIPDNYAVLFLQGGASLQFSMIPMNLTDRGDTTAYILTGQFAKKAYQEGKKWGNAVAVASGEDSNYATIPTVTPDMIPADAKYVHFTGNNTIFGTTFNTLPDVGDKLLVCDLSSTILGKDFDVSKFGLIYAGAQKNMGIAGLTVVIIRKDLIRSDVDPIVPSMMRYDLMAKNDSMYNTPPCWAIYMAGLCFHWVEDQGGIAALEAKNKEKSDLLYNYLDQSRLFHPVADKKDRSLMNVTFTLPTDEQTKAFLALCEERGMINIKGHRSVGGCRASIYNAMPIEGVELLVETMKEFEEKNMA